MTETDQDVEKLLMNGIRAKYPDHKFIGEEDSSDGKKAVLTDDPTWIIDPVDGTMNFVHSFPHSAISVALLVNKVMIDTSLPKNYLLKFSCFFRSLKLE